VDSGGGETSKKGLIVRCYPHEIPLFFCFPLSWLSAFFSEPSFPLSLSAGNWPVFFLCHSLGRNYSGARVYGPPKFLFWFSAFLLPLLWRLSCCGWPHSTQFVCFPCCTGCLSPCSCFPAFFHVTPHLAFHNISTFPPTRSGRHIAHSTSHIHIRIYRSLGNIWGSGAVVPNTLHSRFLAHIKINRNN